MTHLSLRPSCIVRPPVGLKPSSAGSQTSQSPVTLASPLPTTEAQTFHAPSSTSPSPVTLASWFLLLFSFLLITGGPPSAFAQTSAPPSPTSVPAATRPAAATSKPTTQPAVKKPEPPKDGWFPKLSLGLNTSLSHSVSVPGVEDGFTVSFGVVLAGELLWRSKQHEWKSEIKGIHTQTKTPQIEPFVKTADNLDLKSFYSYQFRSVYQLRVTAGLELNTALFPGDLVGAADTPLVLLRIDGSKDNNLALKNIPFRLTPAFTPLLFKQKLGFNVEPYKEPFADLNIRLTATAQEVWASGFSVNDDVTTPRLELRELQNYIQVGLELNVSLKGEFNKIISYAFITELMFPAYTSIPTPLTGFDLLNADLSFKVSIKIAKWASLDYVFQAKKVPLLTENWQVTNNLVLSIKADIF